MKKTFKINIQCKGEDGKIGSFLTNDKGDQITITFVDLINLFNSALYKQLKAEHIVV